MGGEMTDRRQAISCVVQQAFDTAIFGVPYHRVVDLDIDCLMQQIPPLLGQRPLIIDAKVPADRSDVIRFLQGLGFRIVCTQIALSHDLSQVPSAIVPVTISNQLLLAEEIIHSHALNFQSDRFSLDPLIDRTRRDRLYEEWVRNSLSGLMQVATIGNNICCFKQRGDLVKIDLLSVLEKHQGIGGNLVRAVLEYAAQRQTRIVDVVTECGNTPAWRLYLSCGFRVSHFIECLHLVSI